VFTNKLTKTVPYEKWDNIPEIIQTNISWQVGHLIMSHYFHSIIKKIPIKDYDELFTKASPENSVGKIDPALLSEQLNMVQQKSLASSNR
jgi:hypothetical protein